MSRFSKGRVTVLLAAIFLVAGVTTVAARSAENIFAGKVLILKKRPPSRFKSSGGFVKFLRQNSISTVYANEDNEWTFETFAFFKKPLGDYEVDMAFYDVTDGAGKDERQFRDSYVQYTQDRNTRALSGKAHLTRPSFDANRKYMIVVQSKGKELAKGFFTTKGISQEQIDMQKRVDFEVKQMEKSMADLQEKARLQEEEQRRLEEENKKASENLF